MIIRNAKSSDLEKIDHVVRAAFAASEFGHNGEAELVQQLCADGAMAASLVAEENGDLIGYALFSVMSVQADGQPIKAAALAPVSVLPDAQTKGVGSTLIETGLRQLSADCFQISFVLGHADYYPRFGYRADLAAPYASPYSGPHFMAVHLDSGLVVPQRGCAEYAPAFARMDQE